MEHYLPISPQKDPTTEIFLLKLALYYQKAEEGTHLYSISYQKISLKIKSNEVVLNKKILFYNRTINVIASIIHGSTTVTGNAIPLLFSLQNEGFIHNS